MEFGIVRAEQGGSVTGTETDAEGRFILKPLAAGEYDVKVQAIGLQPAEITGVRVDPGLIVRLKDVHLASMLGTIVVERYKWEEPLIRPDDPSRMVMTTAQIKTNAVRKDPVKMIASMTPGVTKSANSDELYFRGSRAGAMAYYVDGVKVTGTNPGVPSEAINSVSVYTGGLPAKYGDVTGGVVAIDTKSYFDLWQQRNSGR
ncbi:MAG: TonB-dependent receptor [Flavobacteriales bacterium]|nr:TonB-dependent receptor [Flavobacteriales bacterium]